MGYVKSEQKITATFLRENIFAIVNLGKTHDATASFSAPYDPKREKGIG